MVTPSELDAMPEGAAVETEPDPPVLLFEVIESARDGVRDESVANRLRTDAAGLVRRLADRITNRGQKLQAFATSPDEPGARKVIYLDADDLDARRPVWFFGDLHGDLEALECALAHVESESGPDDGPPLLVLLGDLIDDGPQAYEVMLRVLEMLDATPDRVALLAGNHDEALSYDVLTSRFVSSVHPGDFAVWLNDYDGADREVVHAAARLFISVVAAAPRALFFWDGLFAAHGGIPQRDLWGGLTSQAGFEQSACLQDFVWTRAHERAPRRRPDRTERGAEFGSEDFAAFCEVAERVLGRPVRRMVRGHDHIFPERFSLYERYTKRRLLTLNTMGRAGLRGLPVDSVDAWWFCVARWVPNGLPEVHRLRMPDATERVTLRIPRPTVGSTGSGPGSPGSGEPAGSPTEA